MHKAFRKALENASGESQFIIAVNLDIRGFSSFSKTCESPDVAMFIKRVYMKLIDNYFPSASFFKPTGDGLLLTIPYTEKNLQSNATKTVQACISALSDFSNFCVNDPMVNFEVPRKLGIGVARGTACRLVSKNKTLDYSGRVLNLASRLMDLARPTGIVLDGGFDINILSNKQITLFAKDNVYIKGIAESESIDIYYTKNLTRISPLNKQQLDKIKWNIIEDNRTLKKIKELGPRLVYTLQTEPIDPHEIKIKIIHPGILRGRKSKDFLTSFDFSDFEYDVVAGKPEIILFFDILAKRLVASGVKNSWYVTIKIMYPER